MHSPREYRASLIFAAAFAGNALLSGVTSEPVHARSHWNAHANQAYRDCLHEQRLEPREFIALSAGQRQDYWS
jgi:hypothetical protein